MTFQVIPDDLLALASPAEREAYGQALRKHLARRSPIDFALTVRPEAVDYTHTRYISDAIADIPPWGGLIVIMGPRQGKSYLCSESTPAWALSQQDEDGKFNQRVLHATYGAEYTASKLSPVVHELVKANVPLTPPMHKRRQAITDFQVDPKYGRGFYFGTGVGGPMTGMPADWLVLDDLIKNQDDAKSQLIRDNVWKWYTTVAAKRGEPGFRTLVVGTPWHEDDILMRLIAHYKDDPRWRIIHLPSIAEEEDELGREPGTALCPERYPIEQLREQQRLDPLGFAAQHQGRPTPEDGDVFKGENLLTYKVEDRPEHGIRFATVDTAHSTKKRADYSVITCFLATPGPGPKLYVTRMFREKVPSGELLSWFDQKMASIPKEERPVYAGVEDKSFGSTMLSTARIQGRRGKVPLRPIPADSDKVARAQPAATISTQGQLLFPEGAPWWPDARHELLMFPNGKHDDIVDTISNGAIEFLRHPTRKSDKEKPEPGAKTPTQRAHEHLKAMKKGGKKDIRAARRSLLQ